MSRLRVTYVTFFQEKGAGDYSFISAHSRHSNLPNFIGFFRIYFLNF